MDNTSQRLSRDVRIQETIDISVDNGIDYIPMNFEFDSHKSASNRRKHGIDFPAAQALWDDSDRIEIPARTDDEPRFMVIGKIGSRVWAAVITYRDENVRVISVRSARRKEIAIYESEGL